MTLLTLDYPSCETVGAYRIDSARKVRIEVYRGRTGLEEIKSIIGAMASDPCWSPGLSAMPTACPPVSMQMTPSRRRPSACAAPFDGPADGA